MVIVVALIEGANGVSRPCGKNKGCGQALNAELAAQWGASSCGNSGAGKEHSTCPDTHLVGGVQAILRFVPNSQPGDLKIIPPDGKNPTESICLPRVSLHASSAGRRY